MRGENEGECVCVCEGEREREREREREEGKEREVLELKSDHTPCLCESKDTIILRIQDNLRIIQKIKRN
jgi:hypothetical protein